MSKVLTNPDNYLAIADAIRAKGVEGQWKPSEMASAISEIKSGGPSTGGSLLSLSIEDYTALANTQIKVSATSVDANNSLYDVGNYFNPSTTPFFMVGDLEGGGSFYTTLMYVNYPEKFTRLWVSNQRQGNYVSSSGANFLDNQSYGGGFSLSTYNENTQKIGRLYNFTDTSFIIGPVTYNYSKKSSTMAIIPLIGG